MKAGLTRIFLLSIALLLLLSVTAEATHLRAGEITVRRDACNSLKFWITVTVFTNTNNTNVLFGGDDDILDFGDGSDPDGDGRVGILVPETDNTPRPDLGEGIATASYTIDHIYSAGSSYTISYSEPNRNEGVVNMDGSINTRFYIETEIVIDPFLGCNAHTPILAVPPIDRGCTGVAWFHNPGAFDLDGDSLSYEMVKPFRERNTTVVNYRDPDDAGFYLNYPTGNEAGTGEPTFSINSVDGTITWDAPGSAGEYNIAFIIKEWRRLGDDWIEIGFVRRDMQIIIEDCDNERPDLIVPEDICIEAGQTFTAEIFGTDPDGDQVKIEAFSEIFELAEAQSPATFAPDPPEFVGSPATSVFTWKTQCDHIKDQPYQIVFKITDNPSAGPRLVTFKTWNIRVVGPAPEWPEANAAVPDFTNRTTTLTWEPYFCQNAEILQVWRRVDSLAFSPDTCQTGMPDNLGYSLIAELPVDLNNNTTYTDDNGGQGLAPGAVYCYRLVAIFPAPRGGESYVSEEVCIPAIESNAPLITNVTIDRTGSGDGQITVRWIPPLDISADQFPPPYTYRVFRAEGFSESAGLVEVADSDPADTVVTDVGLNTETRVYNYRVIAIDNNQNTIDTSAVASSVRMEAKSQLNKIELIWSAEVPWSNQVQGLTHKLYRGDEGATTPDQLQLIAEIDVTSQGLTYIDEGQHDGVPLEGGRVYCYYVETYGAYGNPDIAASEPFINRSQIICSQPGDEEPPCKPETPVPNELMDCEAYSATEGTCQNNVFQNIIKWNRVSDDCGDDVAFYRVYFTASTEIDFIFLGETRDTTFTHSGLTSFAGCYKISAVDRSGNESELSDPVCIDNCPYYELPNIFSPNNDACNDLFSAYSNRDLEGETGEEGDCHTPSSSKARCARFVDAVTFRVYNRWGKLVYSYRSGGENTIFIDWDGRASDGSELSAGVYYYTAEVTFDSVDPAKREQSIKGWVHLVR